MIKKVNYNIDGKIKEFFIEGNTICGEPFVLLSKDDNLLQKTSFKDTGFTIVPFRISDDIIPQIQAYIYKKTNILVEDLEKYHQYLDEKEHLELISSLYNGLNFNDFGFLKRELIEAVSSTLKIPVTTKGHGISKVVTGDSFQLRIVRPLSNDNNPFHRDVWLNRLRNCINIYLPLVGSNKNTSLPLVPGSHLWKESEIERTTNGAMVNGSTYTVPAVTESSHNMTAIRPDPKPGEMLLFSPYLIHGGASNLTSEITRVSIECRFWRDLDKM